MRYFLKAINSVVTGYYIITPLATPASSGTEMNLELLSNLGSGITSSCIEVFPRTAETELSEPLRENVVSH